MDLLSRLEQALEGMVEGVFSRAFRTQLQPIEVAKRLTREVETHRVVSVSATYVPNVYTVQLSPETYAGFQAISGRLLAELEQYLREFTGEHNYQTIGPIAVRLTENADIKTGEMLVNTANDVGATPSSTQSPSVLRSFPTPSPPSPAGAKQERTMLITTTTTLEITAGECLGRVIPLATDLPSGAARPIPSRCPTPAPPAITRKSSTSTTTGCCATVEAPTAPSSTIAASLNTCCARGMW